MIAILIISYNGAVRKYFPSVDYYFTNLKNGPVILHVKGSKQTGNLDNLPH
jgi:hypothetical protein